MVMRYSEEVEKQIQEKQRRYLERRTSVPHGNWTKVKGTIEGLGTNAINECKEMMYIAAQEYFERIGVDISKLELEWVVKQFPVKEGEDPYITIAWKTEVPK
ncbi:hypothetical protein DXC69_02975 [Paenibacillus polymyxa]|nr:hypothetical protein DXC69_02975 [Paenibacillus polymyxa]